MTRLAEVVGRNALPIGPSVCCRGSARCLRHERFRHERFSGNMESESRSVSGFTAIKLTGSGEVTIDQTGTDSLTIEADDNVLPKVTSNVVDGTLMLGVEGNVSSSTPIKFVVTRRLSTASSPAGQARSRPAT